MLSFENWKTILRAIQWTSGALGVLLNSILILLIIFRSPKHLGAYKYLMMYISIFAIFYSILDTVTEPHLFSAGPAYVLFRYFKHSKVGRQAGVYLLVANSGSFGFSVALFAVHFIYRYGVADVGFRKKYLIGWRLIALCLVPVIYFIWWGGLVFIFFRPSPQADDFMRIPLLQNYDTRIEDVSYIIVWFYTTDKNQKLQPIYSTFFAIACCWFMMSTSFFCVLYFGIKCYRRITQALKNSKLSSYYAKSIQQQLFQALVLQTLIPVVLMYVPVGILVGFPMLNIEVGFISSFVVATIAIYPAVDPLPTMFIVESYRKTLLCGCWKNTKKPEDGSGNVQN